MSTVLAHPETSTHESDNRIALAESAISVFSQTTALRAELGCYSGDGSEPVVEHAVAQDVSIGDLQRIVELPLLPAGTAYLVDKSSQIRYSDSDQPWVPERPDADPEAHNANITLVRDWAARKDIAEVRGQHTHSLASLLTDAQRGRLSGRELPLTSGRHPAERAAMIVGSGADADATATLANFLGRALPELQGGPAAVARALPEIKAMIATMDLVDALRAHLPDTETLTVPAVSPLQQAEADPVPAPAAVVGRPSFWDKVRGRGRERNLAKGSMD